MIAKLKIKYKILFLCCKNFENKICNKMKEDEIFKRNIFNEIQKNLLITKLPRSC